MASLRFLYVLLATISCSFLTAQEMDFLKARAFEENGHSDSAFLYYSKYFDKRPQDINAIIDRGTLFFRKNQIQTAIEDFQRAEKLKKDVAAFQLAKCYARQRDTTNAITFLKRHLNSSYKLSASEIRLEPSFAFIENTFEWKKLWQENWYNKLDEQKGEALFMLKSGDWMAVINFVNDLSKDGNLRNDLLAIRAEAYMNMDNFSMALTDMNKVLESNKRNLDFYELRATIFLKLANYKSAEADFTKALSIQPDNFKLYIKRAICSMELNQLDLASQDINLFLELFPGNKEALLLMVKINAKAEQNLKALSGINQLLANDTINASYFLIRAGLYEKSGINIQAEKDYNRSLQLNPNNVEALLARGKFLFRNNNVKAACIDWQKAEKLGNLEAGRLKWENCGR